MSENFKILESFKIARREWDFFDFRLNIPPLSFGSDASNPHTQYSNAVASCTSSNNHAIGACFTLGEGNQFICAAADYLITELDGLRLKDILESQIGLAEVLGNPRQLRWISPNSGISQMAAGLVINTIIDFASKQANLPAWKFMASLEVDEFLKLISLRHLKGSAILQRQFKMNMPDRGKLNARMEELEECGIPTYFTTWIGSSAVSLSNQIHSIVTEKGITKFKIKIGSDIDKEKEKIEELLTLMPSNVKLAADANQSLTYIESIEWMSFLSTKGFLWLEEPFAPDNVLQFRELVSRKVQENWDCEIATGENCPNLHVAQALLEAGVDRFQADPCRMQGFSEAVFSGFLAKQYGAEFTPHAGGSGLDEMSPHMQFFFLASIDYDKSLEDSLTENIGFCSKFYLSPTEVKNGRIQSPRTPGFLVGVAPEVSQKLVPYQDGISWLEL